ncbi:MAG: DinB family protein [Candidatus Limnocylindrales bacterium]
MTRPLLADAFDHHVWATVRLMDACLPLTEAQLSTFLPGTYGSIIDMWRHIAGGDAGYLSALTGGRVSEIEGAGMDLAALRDVMASHGMHWATVIAESRDPDLDVIRHREDGTESHAPLGIRLAQALDHGTDHRSQICTALTSLGIEPPDIDAWAFAWEGKRLWETGGPA